MYLVYATSVRREGEKNKKKLVLFFMTVFTDMFFTHRQCIEYDTSSVKVIKSKSFV